MDTELAKTFLEIVSTRSFVRAAERLNIAQTTVSARIRLLEERLGRRLFVRNKGGASLTPAGEQFLRYAPMFIQLWQRARHVVAVPEDHRSLITVGAEVSLWQPLLLDWVTWMRRSRGGWAWIDGVDAPLGEETEAYRVTLESADGAVRTIETTVPIAHIPAADRGPGRTTIRIVQRCMLAMSASAILTLDDGA